jgi:dipeptidyl aminopeptidase/acylaminoacyl peptidase
MRFGGLLSLVMVGACGRTAPLHPAGPSDAAPGASPDTPFAQHDSPPADGPRGLDGTDAPPPDTACSALKRFSSMVVLTNLRTRKVTFAPDGSWFVLKVRQEAPPGIGYPDQLVRLALPSGEMATISSEGDSAEALGQRDLLVLHKEEVAVYEQGALRTLAVGTCAHLATPDGSRLYVIRDCAAGRGYLDVVDVASGAATTLAGNVSARSYWAPDFSVSPSGRYFAFVVQSPDGGEASSLLHLADRNGKVYALASQPGANAPWFASDDRLLFSVGTNGLPGPNASLRAHVPGSGDTAYTLAATGQAAGLHGYKISADGLWLLGVADSSDDAGFGAPGVLYAIRLDGTGENLLASTLVPHWLFEAGLDSFGWSGDGARAIYLADRGAVWASDRNGSAAVRLSPRAWYRAAPLGDQVAVVEDSGDAGSNQLRVLAMGSLREVFSFASDGSLAAPDFTPDARGLLFVNTLASGVRQLRYFSAAHADSVVLGEWQAALLDTNPGGSADPLGRYPMDPTGCFTIVDTDLPPGPGTRFVLLPES